jgi:DNA repair exonuclease SbcCD ATPase subunit
MDCSAARSTDVDALLAQIAALTAQVAEQDARIAQEQAEKEALARKLAQEAAESAELARKLAEETAKNAALEDALAAADDEVRRITEILAMFKRRQFGPGSEKLDPDQFELTLEDLEIALSRAETEVEAALDKAGDGKQRKRRRKNLGALPAHLERIELLVDIESKSCPCCNGDLHVIGEDASERLDVVPAQFRVLVTRRRASWSTRASPPTRWWPKWWSRNMPIIVRSTVYVDINIYGKMLRRGLCCGGSVSSQVSGDLR